MSQMKQMMVPLLVLAALVLASISFAFQGVGLQGQVAGEEAKFHTLQSEYFIESKQMRDAAESGSALNQQLTQIQNYPSELLRLKLVGIGKILTGIYFTLLAIVFLLFVMPFRLGKLIKESR